MSKGKIIPVDHKKNQKHVTNVHTTLARQIKQAKDGGRKRTKRMQHDGAPKMRKAK